MVVLANSMKGRKYFLFNREYFLSRYQKFFLKCARKVIIFKASLENVNGSNMNMERKRKKKETKNGNSKRKNKKIKKKKRKQWRKIKKRK